MSYPEIAEFLSISEPAGKKRALSARRRLKTMMEAAEETLLRARPVPTAELRGNVLLFSAIHRRDVHTVTALVEAQPSLAQAIEDWSPDEAAQAGLGYSGRASALIRAAETGLVAMAEPMVKAGAPVDGPCACDGGETPLWAAAVAGKTRMVEYLLDKGADPNVAAFHGATPLHAAVQRDRHDLVPLLLAAGADPHRLDGNGRSPADWARLTATRALAQEGPYLWTGVRVIDLFAPVRRGSRQWWPAAYGLGQFVMAGVLSAALAPDDTWYIGFDQAHVDSYSVRHGMEECALGGHIHLAPRNLSPVGRRRRFGEVVRRLSQATAGQLVVFCLVDAGHTHDVEVVLPALSADPRVLTTVVIEPFTGQYPQVGTVPPEVYHQQVAFDRRRARRGLYPAIDPWATTSRSYPSDRHRHLVEAARSLLATYDRFDPELSLPPLPDEAGWDLHAGQALVRYLSQPIAIAEPFTSEPAELTPHSQLLDEIEEMVQPPVAQDRVAEPTR